LIYELEKDEKCLKDGGYNNNGIIFETPAGHNNCNEWLKAKALAGHACANRRFKQWVFCSTRHRGDLDCYRVMSLVVANITNVQLQGEDLWNVENQDGPMGAIFYEDWWECHDEMTMDITFYSAGYDNTNLSAGQLCDLLTRLMHVATRTAIYGSRTIVDDATALR